MALFSLTGSRGRERRWTKAWVKRAGSSGGGQGSAGVRLADRREPLIMPGKDWNVANDRAGSKLPVLFFSRPTNSFPFLCCTNTFMLHVPLPGGARMHNMVKAVLAVTIGFSRENLRNANVCTMG